MTVKSNKCVHSTRNSHDLQMVLLLILKFQIYFPSPWKPHFNPQLIGRLRQPVAACRKRRKREEERRKKEEVEIRKKEKA